MAEQPYSKIPPMKQVAFISALLSPKRRPEGPTLTAERREQAWQDASRAYFSVTDAAGMPRAADRLIRCPIPPSSRTRMAARLRMKRKALRAYGFVSQGSDWAEIIEAEAVALPAAQKGKGRRSTTEASHA